eukprot:6386861-Alexandrium_andersonii.AAC.1
MDRQASMLVKQANRARYVCTHARITKSLPAEGWAGEAAGAWRALSSCQCESAHGLLVGAVSMVREGARWHRLVIEMAR